MAITSQLEAVLGTIEVQLSKPPVDAIYGVVGAGLEQIGQSIGANDGVGPSGRTGSGY